MKSILVMKPGREGKAAAEAAAKGGMPVFFWPAFSFRSAKRSQADIEKLVQEARDGALLIVVSPAAVRCLSEIVPDFRTARILPRSAPRVPSSFKSIGRTPSARFSRREHHCRADQSCFLTN